ncbi:hypothetical protein FB45DRAFT_931848 [Roridomyces roridus]|uniref:AB hydrolase-1 domain-containing protein n=1 Tax=Roridomyces roridus TaxID=1738132 RepID=A0AAD7FE27_9AGAR|nr:hypothetical protein FB45DRAFT_931848 [Roridomyces roridus]
MPTLTLPSGVEFFYTDSGTPDNASDYTTLLIIHGHTFHSGTFGRLSAVAPSNSLRIVCVNRREYPASSPYNPAELAAFMTGTTEQRTSILAQQGHDLALFLDGLIVDLALPEAGGVAVAGWSLGTIFLTSLICSMETLPQATQERLSDFVHTIILLQCPSLSLGLPTPLGLLIPHTDPKIAPEDRGSAFVKWVSSYFVHGDLSTRNLNNLTYDNIDTLRPPTISTLKPDDLHSMVDFAPGERYDNIIGLDPFQDVVYKQTIKALFDSKVRQVWGRAAFWSVYGDAEPWNIIYGGWFLEDQAKAAGLEIHSKIIQGCNHFLVWEEPDRAIKELKSCFNFQRPRL